MHHGVTFTFVSVKVCSPAIFETCFSYDKHIWITTTDYYLGLGWVLKNGFEFE